VPGRVGVILVGAGESRRMEGIDKVFTPLQGRPLLDYSFGVLASVPEVAAGVIVLSEHGFSQGQEVLTVRGWAVGWNICIGGARRQDSVRLGLEKLGNVEWVIIHDAARPCVDQDMVYRGLEAAKETGAAVAAVPVTDTIKVVDQDSRVVETLDRSTLWSIQTPQVFRRDLLEASFASNNEDATDEATLLERMGYTVRVFQGNYGNIKVTTPQDLAMAEAILASRVKPEVLPSA
jgi:2-C-methyl-D-erythritol 4-phosphate cytidylyltransferase